MTLTQTRGESNAFAHELLGLGHRAGKISTSATKTTRISSFRCASMIHGVVSMLTWTFNMDATVFRSPSIRTGFVKNFFTLYCAISTRIALSILVEAMMTGIFAMLGSDFFFSSNSRDDVLER